MLYTHMFIRRSSFMEATKRNKIKEEKNIINLKVFTFNHAAWFLLVIYTSLNIITVQVSNESLI